MRIPSSFFRAWIVVAFCAYGTAAHALIINLQYQSGTLFAPAHDSAAKAAINAAAADLSSAITSSLGAINTDVYVGTNGQTTATMDWHYQFINPTTGDPQKIDNATIAANTVTIHVGTRSFLGSTLGVGGPSGIGNNLSVGPFGSQLVGAMAIVESASEAAYRRGGGPRIGTIDGSVTLQGVTASYSIDYGLAYGSVAFDNDTNNNGQPNSAAELNNYWHWNHTTPVATGKRDLYSVALHEMIHVLGIGTSEAWEDNIISGTNNWTGSEVLAITGSGTNLVSGGHIANGTMSQRISDGMPQGVVMDHLLPLGQRKSLTVLDLAFLRDIGWETITPMLPSSPADFNNDGLVNSVDLGIWQNAFANSTAGDANGDGVSDGHDFLIWQREYTGNSPLVATHVVPEPGTMTLVTIGLMIGCLSRRTNGVIANA